MMLLTFLLDDWKCALDISWVDRAYRAVAVTPVPEAPAIVLGIVNVRGMVLPVVNLRGRFHLPEKQLTSSAHFIVAHTPRRSVVLVVDSIDSVMECDEQDIIAADAILPGMEHVEGVLRLKDGMILIHDLGSLLSLEEEAQLDHVIEA